MAKFDNLIKYLGKEDSYSPDEIIKGIEAEGPLGNLDELSNLPGGHIQETKGANSPRDEIGPELLSELETLDTAPPKIEDLMKAIETVEAEITPEEQPEKTPEKEMPLEETPEEIPSIMEPRFMEMPPKEEAEAEAEAVEEKAAQEPNISEIISGISESAEPEFQLPEMPETEETPEFEFPDFKAESPLEPSEEIKIGEEIAPEIPITPEPEVKAEPVLPSETPGPEIPPVPGPEIKAEVAPEIPPFTAPETPPPEFKPPAQEEVGHDDALKIREKINNISDPILRKKVRQIILESRMPPDSLKQLMTMLLNDESEARIRTFVDSYLPEPAFREREEPRKRPPSAGRRVIYTEEAKRVSEFRREFTGATRYFFSFVIFIIAFIIFLWQLVWIPYTAAIHYNRGLTYFKVFDYDHAEQEFEAGKHLESSKIGGPDLNWNSTYASNYIAQKQFDRAKKKYEDALGYNPYHTMTIYNYADFYKNVLYPPKYEEAIKLYGRLTNKWPDNFDYLDKIGITEIEWGDRTGDLSEYSNANNLYESYVSKPSHARHVDSYFRLLDIALRFTNSINIDNYYDRIDFINKNAVNVHTLTDLARYYIDNRRLDRAKLVFNKMMPAKPAYDEAYYEHGRYLTLNLDYFNAMKEESNAIILNSRNGKAYNLLGEIYYAYKGDSDTNATVQAIKQFENSIQYAPNYYKPYANLGHIFFYNRLNFENPEDAYEKAFSYYKTANMLLEKDRTDDLLSYNLGWLYYKYNDNAGAFNEFSKLYVNDPHNPILSYNLGNIYYKSNNFSFAKIEYDKAIEYYQAIADRIGYINPDLNRHKEIYSQLARCYNNRGVTYAAMAKKYKKDAPEFEQNALLDFYKAKDDANKINVIYNNAEYNIKYMINRSISKNNPALDNELVKRTTLQRFTEEFRQKMISNI